MKELHKIVAQLLSEHWDESTYVIHYRSAPEFGAGNYTKIQYHRGALWVDYCKQHLVVTHECLDRVPDRHILPLADPKAIDKLINAVNIELFENE